MYKLNSAYQIKAPFSFFDSSPNLKQICDEIKERRIRAHNIRI